MGASDIQFGIKLTADGSGFVGEVRVARAEIDKLADSTAAAGSAASEAAAAQGGLRSEFGRLAGAVLAGNLATKAAEVGMRALSEAVALVKQAALDNARFEELGIVMRVVGNNAGYTATQMQQYADETRSMGISMLESRNTVIQLAQAQIDLSHASQLARAAQDVAVIGMVNSSEALNRMIHGIKSGEVEILRTLGINVSFEASYQKLADSLGVTTAALSEKQKMQAREAAVLEEAAKVSGAYEAAMGAAGKQMRSMARYSGDLKVVLGQAFNEATTVAVMALAEQLKAAGGAAEDLAENGTLKEWGADIADALAFAADAAVATANVFRLAALAIKSLWNAAFASSPEARRAREAELKAEADALVGQMGMFRAALDKRRAAHAADAEAAAAIERGRTESMAYFQRLREQGILSEAQYIETMNAFLIHNYGATGKVAEGAAARVKKAGDEVQTFVKKLRTEMAAESMGVSPETLHSYEMLNAARARGLINQDEWARGIDMMLDKDRLLIAEQQEIDRQLKELHHAESKRIEDLFKTAEALEAENKKLREHNEEIGLTTEQLALLRDVRMAAAIAAKEQELADKSVELQCTAETEAIKEQIAALKERRQLRSQGAALEAEAAKAALDEMTEFAKQAAKNMQDAMGDFFFDLMQGKMENMAQRFKQTLDRMVADLLASQLLKYLVGDFGKGGSNVIGGVIGGWLNGGSGGGWSASQFATQAAAEAAIPLEAFGGYHAGGIAGREPTFTRRLPAAVFARAPRLHHGGIADDEVPAVLRRGEGVFTEEQMRAMGGRQVVINMPVTFQVQGQLDRRSQQQAAGALYAAGAKAFRKIS